MLKLTVREAERISRAMDTTTFSWEWKMTVIEVKCVVLKGARQQVKVCKSCGRNHLSNASVCDKCAYIFSR